MTEALQKLAELSRLEAEREGLQQQLEAAHVHLAEAERRHGEALAKLTAETEDVQKLESLSMMRILAGLRGTREVDLSREQAEQLAAQYAVAGSDSRRKAAQREVDDRARRLADIGDLTDRRTAALAEREREITTDLGSAATSARLTEIAGRQGGLEAEAVQLREAITAAAQARATLGDASRHLGDANGWATYDTFFGGGLMADLVKHDKLDKAGELMRRSDAALAHLATELADVQVGAVGQVGIDQMARTFDIWFDNIFSDYEVRSRIREASERVDQLLKDVNALEQELPARLAGVEATLDELAVARRDLLVGSEA